VNNADEEVQEAAGFFSIVSEPARLKILLLLRNGARCGRELSRDLRLTPATTCHHLDRLKNANLLKEQRSGKHVYYSISDAELARAFERSLAVLQLNAVHEKNGNEGRHLPEET
jgi:DNA-binding transcriptional ArsR family regulator